MARGGTSGSEGGAGAYGALAPVIAGGVSLAVGAGVYLANTAGLFSESVTPRGDGLIAAVNAIQTDAGATVTTPTTFAWEKWGQSIGTNPVAQNIGTTTTSAKTLPQSTIDVAINSAITMPGNVIIAGQVIACTGKSGTTQLTGCSGGTATYASADPVNQIVNGAASPSTCGPNGNKPCSGGWSPKAFHAGGAAGTTFGVPGCANGICTWVEMANAVAGGRAIVTTCPATLPLGLAKEGNCLQFTAETNDKRRIFRPVDTQPGSYACAAPSVCDTTADAWGDPMIGGPGVVIYIASIIVSTGSVGAGKYSGSHIFSGASLSSTNADDKPNEKLQIGGNESSNGLLLMDRVTQGSAEGSHWFFAGSSLTTTPVLSVTRIEFDVNEIVSGATRVCDGCSTCVPNKDDANFTVTCANETHEAVTNWYTTATIGTLSETDTPSISRKVVANWKNSHRLNTRQWGGTNTYKIVQEAWAKTFDDAVNFRIP